MDWWEIPILAAGITLGSLAGAAVSDWFKVKVGWMDPPAKKTSTRDRYPLDG